MVGDTSDLPPVGSNSPTTDCLPYLNGMVTMQAAVVTVMRSHTVGTLHLLGFTNIAEVPRWARDDSARQFTVLGFTE
ncbi:hypothetical protein ACQPZ8_19750 [Actinomadura nitritigenes]|uniref:hypothetical protein n=1 Tax=Actinomadura nitritigenes TaxID=134602 RepID=UPI003D922134